jgi:phosphoserine phosphatase
MIDELLKLAEERSKTTKNNFAVFDFDNTCAVNDVAEAALGYMAKNDLFKDASILPDLAGLPPREISKKIFDHYYDLLEAGDIPGAYEFGAKTLCGWDPDSLERLMREVFNDEGETIGFTELFGRKIAKGLKSRPLVINLIKQLQTRGIAVWIISASPAPLVASAMRHFGIEAKLIGVKNLARNGLMTADLEQPMPVVSGKVDCIKLYIDPVNKPLIGAGDSMNDLPMLEYSETKVVVNRHNALSDKAKSLGWFLLDT